MKGSRTCSRACDQVAKWEEKVEEMDRAREKDGRAQERARVIKAGAAEGVGYYKYCKRDHYLW